MGGSYTKAVWYRYGKENFTRSGYEKAKASFVPGQLESIELQGKVYVVTGANSGLGRDLSEWLASKNATVYMVCRNQGRGESAQQNIQQKTGNQNVKLLIGDCGLKSDVDKVVSELTNLETSIDAVVCNAGALLNTYQSTPEGLEVTLATHLVYGTYYLTEKLMPLLKQAAGRSRVVVVSSGGMYQERLSKDLNMTPEKYDGVAAYSRAKRAQVELVEEWSKIYASSGVKFVSCHPGWADTPGVDEAIPGFKKFVGKEFRDSWQGAEGICWLTAIDQPNLVSGEFYLDRQVAPKHLPYSCIHTKCERQDVDWLMTQLRQRAPL